MAIINKEIIIIKIHSNKTVKIGDITRIILIAPINMIKTDPQHLVIIKI